MEREQEGEAGGGWEKEGGLSQCGLPSKTG